MEKFKVGDKVKLTAKFLKATGQYTRSCGSQDRWTILGISGDFVTVDQESHTAGIVGYFTAEELAADPSLKWRRINAYNLMLASKPDHTAV